MLEGIRKSLVEGGGAEQEGEERLGLREYFKRRHRKMIENLKAEYTEVSECLSR